MNDTKQGRPQTHSALLVCYEEREGGEIYFLAIRYTEKKNCNPVTFVKFPVETGLERESPRQTATSGMYQEVASSPSTFSFRFVSEEPIYKQECAGDPDKGGGTHTKCVFLITGIKGDIRTIDLVEEGKRGRSDEKLSPPQWYEADELFDLMKERGVKFHRTALIRALSTLARERTVYARYSKVLENPLNREYLAD